MLEDFATNQPNKPVGNVLPLFLGYWHIGWVAQENLPRFIARRGAFAVKRVTGTQTHGIQIISGPDDCFDSLSRKIDRVLREMYEENQDDFGKWNDEYLPVFRDGSGKPLFKLQRCAAAFFGVPTTGVHLNLFVKGKAKLKDIWVAKRSKFLDSFPNKYDQPVAGFNPFGKSSWQTLVEEALQEASVTKKTLQRAKYGGVVHFLSRLGNRIQLGIVNSYDLEVDATFIPKANDSEVGHFELFSESQLISKLWCKNKFKFDSRLIFIDFLHRHSGIDRENNLTEELFLMKEKKVAFTLHRPEF